MPWNALIAVLIQYLAPLALDWLRELLKSLPERSLSASEAVAVGQVFDAAEGRLWWWQFARRAALTRCRRVVEVRAGELVRAARGEGNAPVMTAFEIDRANGG